MQLIQHKNGVQTLLTSGMLNIDPSDPDPTYSVIWDTAEDGGDIDPEKVGGYSRVNDELVYSQSDFNEHETLKATVEASQLAAKKQAIRETAKGILEQLHENGIIQRAFSKVLLDEINSLRSAAGMGPRTLSQLKTAIENEINSGNSDGE